MIEDLILPPASYKLVTQIKIEVYIHSACVLEDLLYLQLLIKVKLLLMECHLQKKFIFSNSGIVVEVKEEDLLKYQKHGNLKGLKYQIELEKVCANHHQIYKLLPLRK